MTFINKNRTVTTTLLLTLKHVVVFLIYRSKKITSSRSMRNNKLYDVTQLYKNTQVKRKKEERNS